MNADIIHPGKYIQDIIENTGVSPKEVSIQLGISESYLTDIIVGKKDIDSEICTGLVKIFGGSSDYWKKLQEKSIKKKHALSMFL